MKVRIRHQELARRMAAQNISQNRWAQKLGISRSYLSMILNGKRAYPGPDLRQRLLQQLDISFEELFEVEGAEATVADITSESRPSSTGMALPDGKGNQLMAFMQDFRYALRSNLRNPIFSLIVVATLALGIGATSTMFALVDGVLLRPLNYPESSRLAALGMKMPGSEYRLAGVSVPNFLDWQSQLTTMEGLAAASWESHVLLLDGVPTRISGGQATEDFFPLLRTGPALGRLFRKEDFVSGSARPAILSHGGWQRLFGGDPAILGQTVQKVGGSFSIIGILPAGFEAPEGMSLDGLDIWTPFPQDLERFSDRSLRPIIVVGRLRPEVELEAARQELVQVTSRLAELYPKENATREGDPWLGGMNLLHDQTVRTSGQSLLFFLGAVAVLFLICCANVAGLIFVRSSARHRETALKSALGARRSRLVGQVVNEAIFLGLVGALAAIPLSWLGLQMVKTWSPGNIPRLQEVGIDWRVTLFSILLAIGSAILFSIVPALRSSRQDLLNAIRSEGRATAGLASLRGRRLLIAFQVAMAVVLVNTAALLAHSLWKLTHVDPGFLATDRVSVRLANDPTPGDILEGNQSLVLKSIRERIGSLPSVRSAALVLDLPLGDNSWRPSVVIEENGRESQAGVDTNVVSPDYFSTIGMHLLQGRDFSEEDRKGGVPVAIVTQRMADEYWPETTAVGKRLRLSRNPETPWLTVVGVVGDFRQRALDIAPEPMVFVPYSQHPYFPSMNLVFHSRAGQSISLLSVQQEVWDRSPTMPVSRLSALEDRLSQSIRRERFNAVLLTSFASLALILTLVGIYGIVFYTVQRRTPELGIRLALGAPRRLVIRMVLMENSRWMAAGLAVGFLLFAALNRVVGGFLFDVSPLDPFTLSLVFLLLVSTCLLAGLVPARRAARINPIGALKVQ